MKDRLSLLVILLISIIHCNFAIAEEIASCEGKILQIAENSSSTLFTVYDGLSVTIFDTKNHSQIDKFIDEKIARINFYTEGENEFLAAITETGQFVVRKLIKTEGTGKYRIQQYAG